MLHILVTGGHGQLGSELQRRASLHAVELTIFSRTELDITDETAVHLAIATIKPDVIVNAAAYTQVDQAEQATEQAFSVNSIGAKTLAIAAAIAELPLIHVSTDYVFDGTQTKPYREDDVAKPLNVYGESKWQGEQHVREAHQQHIILRVSSVFSSHGNNFVKTILRLAREKNSLRVVADQHMCPTAAMDIADAIFVIAKKITKVPRDNHWGTYHFCSSEATHWHAFSEAIIAIARQHQSLKVETVQAISTAEYPTPARRPQYSVLDSSKLKKHFGIELASWRPALEQVIKELCT